MPRGDRDNWGGRRISTRPDAKRAGRKAMSVKVAVSLESAAIAQRLMLHFPAVPTVEALYEYAMQQLAARTDD